MVDPGFPIGGHGPITGGRGPPTQILSPKMYAKMKELGPVGGACAGHAPPPIRQCNIFLYGRL